MNLFWQVECQKFANFFTKLLKFVSLAFQKTKNYQNLTTESGSKQWFSLLQEKVVIQAVSIKARF